MEGCPCEWSKLFFLTMLNSEVLGDFRDVLSTLKDYFSEF